MDFGFRDLQQIQRENEQQVAAEENTRMSSIDMDKLFNSSALEKMQQETVSSNVPLPELRQKLTSIIDALHKQEDQLQYHAYMGKARSLPADVFLKAKGFYVPDAAYFKSAFREVITVPEYGLLTSFGEPMYDGRFIYPVLGFDGEVLGLIGYDKFHTIKYLLSRTIGFGQNRMFYGMQNMRWIYEKDYIIVVEGIVDVLLLNMLGEPAIGLNGNILSDFVLRILKRFDNRVLFMPDNNETGERAINFWMDKVPAASILRVSEGNDFDEWRKKNPFPVYQSIMAEIKRNFQVGLRKDYVLPRAS